MLSALTHEPDIAWPRVELFHLDEYIGLAPDHPASFRRYLRERFVDRVPVGVFHAIDGQTDVETECRRLAALIAQHPIDVALVGIGENCHLAFNDPPADFDTQAPFLRVALDDACRRQQWSEGWFVTLDDVPREAITMSIAQIMKARAIVCSVPEERKAEAVRAAVEGPISPEAPASILQRPGDVALFLDPAAASRLSPASRGSVAS